MQIIKAKKDAKEFVEDLKEIKDYDGLHRFIFWDPELNVGGKHGWTEIMYYSNTGAFFRYGEGQGWHDQIATRMDEKETIEFVWENRKYINAELR